MRLFEFFIDLILPTAPWSWRRLSPKQKWLPRVSSEEGGKVCQCVGLTTLSPAYADCLVILGSATSYSPKDLSRSLQGFFTFIIIVINVEPFFSELKRSYDYYYYYYYFLSPLRWVFTIIYLKKSFLQGR
jgi:hypothetical protein